MIFSLPFHVARFFRPTLLETFKLANAGLGDAFAVYGVMAMISYFPGGILADYVSSRRLMVASLVSTAIGGFYFVQIPIGTGLLALYGYWGVTTVFLFWGGLIKATREWGNHNQGRAFGILDGGRGLVAAILSSLAVFLFSQIVIDGSSFEIKQKAISSVIYLYVFATLLAAGGIWLCVPEKTPSVLGKKPMGNTLATLKTPQIWLMCFIVVCAYCGYKGLDNYGLFAVEGLSMNRIDGAMLSSAGAYLRPIGAVCAGFIADRYRASDTVKWCFAVLIAVYGLLALGVTEGVVVQLAILNLGISFLAVYGLRGVYFALMAESRIKKNLTGTAVGIVSLMGYTPDAFFGAVTGRILDAAPGPLGFQRYFIFLVGVSIIGFIAAYVLSLKNRHDGGN